MRHEDRLTAAYAQLKAEQKRKTEEARAKRTKEDQRSRLLRLLEAAGDFSGAGNIEEFAQSWSRYWIAAAKAFRRYSGLADTRGLEILDSPDYAIAQELFEQAMVVRDRVEFATRLHESIERLRVPPDAPFRGLDWGALRSIFTIIAESLRMRWAGPGPAVTRDVDHAAEEVSSESGSTAGESDKEHEQIPLSKRESTLLQVLCDLPQAEGLTGAELIDALVHRGVHGVEQSNLTSRLIPGLRAEGWDIPNRRGVGYYLSKRDREHLARISGD